MTFGQLGVAVITGERSAKCGIYTLPYAQRKPRILRTPGGAPPLEPRTERRGVHGKGGEEFSVVSAAKGSAPSRSGGQMGALFQ